MDSLTFRVRRATKEESRKQSDAGKPQVEYFIEYWLPKTKVDKVILAMDDAIKPDGSGWCNGGIALRNIISNVKEFSGEL